MKIYEINVGAGNIIKLESNRILCNDVVLPWEQTKGSSRLTIIFNQFGPVGAVWANDVKEALDILADASLADGILVDTDTYEAMPDKEQQNCPTIGSYGEPADLTYASFGYAILSETTDCKMLCKFAEARGAGFDSLDF
jgi:hypothetical protein